jgi:hypothetical protein
MKLRIPFTLYADVLALMGLLFFGRCGRKFMELKEYGNATTVLALLALWLTVCLYFLRKQKRA